LDKKAADAAKSRAQKTGHNRLSAESLFWTEEEARELAEELDCHNRLSAESLFWTWENNKCEWVAVDHASQSPFG